MALHRKNGHEVGDGSKPPRFVTATLHVDFMKPTLQGQVFKAIGTVEEIHPKKWKVKTEVYADQVLCASGEVMAVVMVDSFSKKSSTFLLLQSDHCLSSFECKKIRIIRYMKGRENGLFN